MWVKKAGAFMCGVVIVLVCGELTLRIVGSKHPSQQRYLAHYGDTTNAECVVLCAGDSFTVGLGAPHGEDYPRQLYSLLTTHAPSTTWEVVNAGMAGHNAAQMRQKLRGQLDAVKPDIVVMMAGIASFWNKWGYHPPEQSAVAAWLQDLRYRVRLFKLVTLLRKAVEYRMTHGNASALDVPDEELQGLNNNELRTLYAHEADRGRRLYIKGVLAMRKRHMIPATQSFRNGIDIDAEYPMNYVGLGQALLVMGKNPEALQILEEARESFPTNAVVHVALGDAYLEVEEFDKVIETCASGLVHTTGCRNFYELLEKMSSVDDKHAARVNDVLASYSEEYRRYNNDPNVFINIKTPKQYYPETYTSAPENDRETLDWIIADLRTSIETCRSEGADVIMMTYPTRWGWRNPLNEVIRIVAEEYGCRVADNERYFNSLGLRKHAYFCPGDFTDH